MGNDERRTSVVDSDEGIKSCAFDMLEKSIRCLSRYIKADSLIGNINEAIKLPMMFKAKMLREVI